MKVKSITLGLVPNIMFVTSNPVGLARDCKMRAQMYGPTWDFPRDDSRGSKAALGPLQGLLEDRLSGPTPEFLIP